MKRSTALKADPEKVAAFRQRARENSPLGRSELQRNAPLEKRAEGSQPGHKPHSSLKRGKGFAVSPQQRAKVRDLPCIVCSKNRHDATIDPAHVVPRGLGGCDHPDCVVPLCRFCHHRFDREGLDLLPYLEPRCRTELQHAVLHLGLIGALERITHEHWRPTS